MSPRARVLGIVAAAALGAAAATVGAVLAYDDPDTASRAREGVPPLLLDLGVRRDAEAEALREAARLYARGHREEAEKLFSRHDSLQARVGFALATWPRSSTRRLESLARVHPRQAVAHLHVGLARYWEGRDAEALAAWATAARVQPDSLSAVRAGDFLHPAFAPGLPTFVPSSARPRSAPERRLAEGVRLQRLGRPVSARRAFDAALRAAPGSVDAQVAAAVGRFDKEHPERAFGRLGPLARRYQRSASVRFHLGLLLLWSGEVEEGKRQLGLARRVQPGSRHALEAKRFLQRLGNMR